MLNPIPNLCPTGDETGLIELKAAGGGTFRVGENGVKRIVTPADRKVEFIGFEEHALGYVKSLMGYPAIYPLLPSRIEYPIQAVLMDLDGTSVHSEAFWIWIIEQSTASLLENPKFQLEEEDLPHVSGHSVSEHLQYCINKYCPDRSVEEARKFYFEHTRRELRAILEGRGKQDAMVPAPGLKDFLLGLKSKGIRIGLVTSGLYEKAWPEIVSAFRTLGMGDPKDFYDAIITAGFPLRKGEAGTLGELEPKPHPWLYAETARVGLAIRPEERNRVIGIEDSGAGVCSIRLAGFPTVGIGGGNIEQGGTRGLCHAFCEKLTDVMTIIEGD